MRLGLAVRRQAARRAPAAGGILVITNPADMSVNNLLTEELIQRWRAAGARNLATYAFGADLGLPHDFIDPEQADQQVERVYPLLLELLV
jgi:hypothetical protein